MDNIYISIVKDYTDTPGGRYIKDGKYSGEDFRTSLLLPKYNEAINSNVKLVINMDGCFGFPSSFIEEAFGGLARELRNKSILDNIDIISNDQPSLANDITKIVEESYTDE